MNNEQTLAVDWVAIESIKPHPSNPRKNHQVGRVAESIKAFGWRQPIVVDRDGFIVVGHGRYYAAKELGLERVPVHRADDLTPDEAVAYRIADNRAHEGAGWDMELLIPQLKELDGKDLTFDLSAVGWTNDELKELLGPQNGQTDPDNVPEPPDAATTKLGDIWTLGDHRLMCGSSGSAESVDRLLAGDPIHLVNTDPPYNVKVEPRSNNAFGNGRKGLPNPSQAKKLKAGTANITKMRAKDRPLANDFEEDGAFESLMNTVVMNISRVLLPGRAFYVWAGGFPPDIDSPANTETFPSLFRTHELAYAHLLIWDKGHGVIGRKDFMTQYEVCFYGWRRGASHEFFGPNNVTDLWSVKRVTQSKMVHLTEKPVELATRAIEYSSRRGENVLDLFGGSGSTLIGCEQTGRRARLMELDPLYCDVIISRWEQFTGKKAELVKA